MVRAGYARIHNTKDLAGMTVCTLSDSTSLTQLNEGLLKNQIILTVEKLYNHVSTDCLMDRLTQCQPTK
jgi:hypothetical protein